MGYNAFWSGKGKGFPLTCHESTHGEFKYSSSHARASLVVNATPLSLYPRVRTPVRIVYGGRVGPRAGLNGSREEKNCFYWISIFHRSFFNSIIDKHQHMHFFTFKTLLV